MPPRFQDQIGRLNAAVVETFGLSVVLIDPDGSRLDEIQADWRIVPVLIEAGHHGEVISSTSAYLGLNLSGWIGKLPNSDWTVEVYPDGPDPEGVAGLYDIVDASKRGGLWLDLQLSNKRPFDADAP